MKPTNVFHILEKEQMNLIKGGADSNNSVISIEFEITVEAKVKIDQQKMDGILQLIR